MYYSEIRDVEMDRRIELRSGVTRRGYRRVRVRQGERGGKGEGEGGSEGRVTWEDCFYGVD